MKEKTMSPMEANAEHKVIKLQTDNYGTKDYWILIDGDFVCMHKQKIGQESKQKITIKRSGFNRMIKWYTKQQKLRKR